MRAAHPDAVILYKPHPDVEAGLRSGTLTDPEKATQIITGTDPAALLAQVHEVHPIPSLIGFEALLRGVPVTTYGAPFYAGWGLTVDKSDVPPRRRAQPNIEALAHAVLIDYPRYYDPITKLPCPPEIAVLRLSEGDIPAPSRSRHLVSKLRRIFRNITTRRGS